MKEEEDIATYLLQVDGVFNTIISLCEKVDESLVVQKMLRSLPLRFDSKVSRLGKMNDLDSLTMVDLHGILTTDKMRTGIENPSR